MTPTEALSEYRLALEHALNVNAGEFAQATWLYVERVIAFAGRGTPAHEAACNRVADDLRRVLDVQDHRLTAALINNGALAGAPGLGPVAVARDSANE